MADKQPKPQVSNERSELLKGTVAQPNKPSFMSTSNQMFARTQSTPLEDQKLMGKPGSSSLKSKLKLSSGTTFTPGGQSSQLVNTFLSPVQVPTTTATTGATSNASNTYVPNKPLANGPEVGGTYQAPTTTSKPFTPAENKPAPTTEVSEKSATSTTTKPSETVPTPPGSNTNIDAAADKKTAAKKKLSLNSTSFGFGAGAGAGAGASSTSAAFIPSGQPVVLPTQTATAGGPADKAAGEWGKPINKAAEEKEKPKQGSPGKISLKAQNFEGKAAQGQKPLEPIIESKAENKEPLKVEVPENKKSEVKEAKSPVKSEFTEVKAKQHKYGPRAGADVKTTVTPTVTEKAAPKVEPKKEVPKPVETKKVEEPVKTQEVRKVATPVKTEETPKPVAETKKPEPEVKKPVEEAKPKEEIVVLSRVKFEEMIEDLKDKLKDRKLPEVLQVIKDRIIQIESSRQKQQYSSKGGKQDSQKTFARDERPRPAAEPVQQDSGFGRSETIRKELPDQQAAAGMIKRIGLTDEERKKKEELNANVNAWISGMKAERDPEEVIKKKIKFNLNLITADNFEAVKEEILNLAADKVDNCKRVAEFLIENAWTQKQYVNIYAKLCDFMGRSDRLFFDGSKPDSKKKNSFKLHIMKQIQTVFEDDANINLGFKKPFEELNDEEKVLYFAKKKQRILGNVSFIGELFLEKFLVIGLMRIITKSLLQRFLDEYAVYQRTEPKPKNKSCEDTLEGLLKFYEIIGKNVEDKEATKPVDKQKSTASVALFQKCLKQINDGKTPIESLPKLGDDELSLEDLFKIYNIMLDEANISTRIDALIKNLIHRRDSKWAASISKNQGPKTIDEIHREFEREQMEMERRADEYREELYNQPRYVPRPANTKTEVVFQVASSNKAKQQEETKIDTKSIEVDSNISFRPNRGKKGQEESKSASKKPTINPEEIQNNLRDVYRLAQGEEIEDKTSPQDELKKLIAKIGGKEVMVYYFRTFYDGKIEDVKKRLFVPDFLIDEKAIEVEDFLSAFQGTMNKMYDVACDFPGSEKYFAVLILNLCKRLGNGSTLQNIQFTEEFYSREDADLILEFYQDFFRALLKNLATDYADISSKIGDAELKDFAKKIQIDNYDSFKSKI